MKNIFIALSFALAILVGSKLYFESKIETELDFVVQALGPIATLRYKDVSIAFDGSISVTGIAISPHAARELVTVQEVNISSSDPLFWLRSKDNIRSNQDLPELITFKIRQVAANTSLLESQNEVNACLKLNAYFNYSTIGIQKINADIDLSLDFSNDNRPKLLLSVEDTHSSMDINASFIGSNLQKSMSERAELPLDEIRADLYLDQATAEKLVTRCSDSLGIGNEDYLGTIAGSAAFSQNSFGVDLGADFRQALISWLRGGSTLSIFARPKAQLRNIQAAKLYTPVQVVKALRMRIELNQRDIVLNPALSREDKASDSSEMSESVALVPAVEQDPRLLAKSAQTEQIRKASFRTVSVDSANNYIQHNVRLTRVGNKSQVTGWLLGVKLKRLEVEVRGQGRSLIYKVPYGDITKFEVYR